MKVFLAIVGFILFVVVITVGGYQLGWWLKEDAVNRNTQINNNSVARQTALQDEVIDLYSDIADLDVIIVEANPEEKTVLLAQKNALTDRFCEAYGKINGNVTLPNGVYKMGSSC